MYDYSFGPRYLDEDFILMVLSFIIITIIYLRTHYVFEKYLKEKNHLNITGKEAARRILDANGLSHVEIEMTGGSLTDYYDPRLNTVNLSQQVYHGYSPTALGVAAHECGHAIQHSQNYGPIKLRVAIAPIVQAGSIAAIPLAILGVIFEISSLATFGIILYTFVFAFQLITIPIELNASSRALNILEDDLGLFMGEVDSAKKVLSACALTYVAGMITTVITLIRLILFRKR